MALDPDRIAAAFAAALASSATSLLVQVTTWFGVPPPSRREVVRGLAETAIGVFLAVVFGYGFGAPVAEALGGVAALIHLKVKVDALAGGLIVGAMVLRGVPLVVELGLARARKVLAPRLEDAA